MLLLAVSHCSVLYVLLSLGVLVTLSPIDSKSSTHINIINSAFLKRAICPGIGQVHTTRYTLRLATGPSTSTVCADIIRPVTGAWRRRIPSAEPNPPTKATATNHVEWLSVTGTPVAFFCFSGKQIWSSESKTVNMLLANYSFWKWCS